jgi:hypothetical protein
MQSLNGSRGQNGLDRQRVTFLVPKLQLGNADIWDAPASIGAAKAEL